MASGDVTLGLSSPAFAAMIEGSPVLTSRGLEILAQRERALSDAIAAETGTDTVQQRVVAAQLSAPHRVLGAEAGRRSRAGQPRARSSRCWPGSPSGPLTCWSRRWAAT